MTEIIKIVSEIMDVNSYILLNEKNEAIVVDPSFETQRIINVLEEEKLNLIAVLLTHGHFDHIAGVDELREYKKVPVYINKKDALMLTDASLNGSAGMYYPVTVEKADVEIDNQIVNIGSFEVKALNTPGHSKGSMCFFIDDIMISGDTLFNMSIGRTDLKGGSFDEMKTSLEKLKLIDKDYVVYPGHGLSTSLKHEVDVNPFMGDKKWSL